MKIGKLSLGEVVAENIEIEDLKDLQNIISFIADEARFIASNCTFERVCTDFPDKCKDCYTRPTRSHFSKHVAYVSPVPPKLTPQEDVKPEK